MLLVDLVVFFFGKVFGNVFFLMFLVLVLVFVGMVIYGVDLEFVMFFGLVGLWVFVSFGFVVFGMLFVVMML